MKARSHALFLEDMLDAMAKIEDFINGMDYSSFANDDKTLSAVIRKFEIIGEAAKNIPASVKEKHPEIPWKSMSGLRDVIIHDYFGIDAEIIWNIASRNLPELRPMIKKILEQSG